ncbi:MAG TPA: OmpA family protein [Steroidobacteraceae bacterium]|nr:OmpA family protein [Steroidobacteraceae bacterium]
MVQGVHGAAWVGVLRWLALALSCVAAASASEPTEPAWFANVEAELRAALAPTAAVIEHTERQLTVRCPVRLVFAADRAELLPAGTAMLDALARSLRDYKRTQVVVAVYTDTIGTAEFNQQQSQGRAGVVAAYLQIHGVAPERLVARGVGEAAQLPAPDTPEGRDLNRRLELIITPLSS